jgi:hypothetical protein
MTLPTPRVTRGELALLAALVGWGLFGVVLLLIHAADTHTRLTGADGLIGADGELGGDQLQYLAWIRDASAHGLAADLFRLTDIRRVYLQPLFTISGGLYRLGVPLPIAYMVFKPVAIAVLGAGAVAWARRMFGVQAGARAATVALCLFLSAPATELFGWTHTGKGGLAFPLFLLGSELHGADKVWGYVPSAIALGLMPIALLATERALVLGADGRSSRARRAGPLALATGAALIASWLHPWQGITLILILAGLVGLRRGRGLTTLAAPAVATALPLLYYYVLSHADPAWSLASTYEATRRAPAITLIVGFGPLALIAAPGLRRPRGEMIEQALLLWIAATFINYFLNDSFPPHAYQGLAFPFSVLAVRGFQRLRLPALVGWLAVGLLTIPGMVSDARKLVRTFDKPLVQYYLPHDDVAALSWVTHHAPPGGVLAPTPFASVIPSQTGRAVWVGNGYWSRDYPEQSKLAKRLFRGHMRPAAARSFVAGTGARILVADCDHRADLTKALGPMLASTQTFGCARVYVLTPRGL